MRKDRVMDIHNRETTINPDTHSLHTSAHREGAGTGIVFRLVEDDNIFGPASAGNDSIGSGDHNFCAIEGAGISLTGGNHNVFVGWKVGQNATGGDFNFGFTFNALQALTGGNNNFGGGQNSLFNLTSGNNNNGIGPNTLLNLTIGDNCNALGESAGLNLDTNSNNVLCLGKQAGPATLAIYNQEIYIDNHATDAPLIHGDTSAHLVTINGDLAITGTLSKGAGTFKIDHPLDDDKSLLHGFIEGPEYGLLYRGKVRLENGKALVDIDKAVGMTPGTFAALAMNPTVYLQNLTGFSAIRPLEFDGAAFGIIAQDPECSDEISWLVCAERKDKFVMESDTTDKDGRLVIETKKPEKGNDNARNNTEPRRAGRPTHSHAEHQKHIEPDRTTTEPERKRGQRRQLDMEGNIFGKRQRKETAKDID